MEGINEATKLIAKAIEELKQLTRYAWVDNDPANVKIDPIILLLEQSLDRLTKQGST